MMIKIDNECYTLKQCLMGLWVLFDDYRRRYTPKEHIKKAVRIAFYVFIGVIALADCYAIYVILWVLT